MRNAGSRLYDYVKIEKVWKEEEQEGFLIIGYSGKIDLKGIKKVIGMYVGRNLNIYKCEEKLTINYYKSIEILKDYYENVVIDRAGWDYIIA
ncbi:hypothetical protein D307_gp182 [Bacillus phage Bastille]|uniref:Uncharacterized protein n=1 Tax=Bacillus phage Bastille TaxID=57477 RepID=J9PLA3_9CAUD|nr:hypothetical protein D307_gp182 [Bacillus phage Bastille]AEQ34282.1 hypothetical protein [Bacillus phage Bastille]